jgi:hypothetical protein
MSDAASLSAKKHRREIRGGVVCYAIDGFGLIPAAATAATAVATTAAATTTATAATTTAATLFARTSFIDGQRPAIVLLAVDPFDRGESFLIAVHFHEAKAFAPAGVAIHDDVGTLHRAVFAEHLVEI